MKGSQLETQVRQRLELLLEEVPFLRLKRWLRESQTGQGLLPDLSAEVLAKGEPWRLVIEVKSSGEPRYVRSAVQRLRSLLAGARGAYGIVSAPFISDDAGRICRDEGMGYLDLMGNCSLVFADVFVERKGIPNSTQERRPLRTLYSPRAGRVLRVLLEEPRRTWTLQALADRALASLGLVFKVKERLLDLEFAAGTKTGLALTKPEALLRQWGENYAISKNKALELYSQGDPSTLETALAKYCRSKKLTYGFTSFSGAARVAPYSRYLRGSAYVAGTLSGVAKALDWKQVPTGSNFVLLEPYDDGLLYGTRAVDGESVVSDVQLYLDLLGSGTRGREAAEFLLEQRLRAKW